MATQAGDSELSVEEVEFTSNGFQLVGDLHVPGGTTPHGALVIVHGSGAQTRNSTPTSDLVRRRFLDAGYAVLSWDTPGSGDSTGEFEQGHTIEQRAEILVDGIEYLADRPEIDSSNIGVWGLSQAGWVVPMAMAVTDDISFMIMVSGGAEISIEQSVFQWTRRGLCLGATRAQAEIMDLHGPVALGATTYEEYRLAMERLLTIPDLDTYVGVDIELQDEEDWSPWPRDIDAFFDPVTVIETLEIPVLAIFGEHDSQIDPIQGAAAYRSALERAGNPDFKVETIEGVGHTMRPTSSPCVPESGAFSERYLQVIDEWLESHPGR